MEICIFGYSTLLLTPRHRKFYLCVRNLSNLKKKYTNLQYFRHFLNSFLRISLLDEVKGSLLLQAS
jgi:hypothetical protein